MTTVNYQLNIQSKGIEKALKKVKELQNKIIKIGAASQQTTQQANQGFKQFSNNITLSKNSVNQATSALTTHAAALTTTAIAVKKLNNSTTQSISKLARFRQSIQTTAASLLTFSNALKGMALGYFGSRLLQTADEVTMFKQRLGLVTKTAGDTGKAFDDLINIANQTGSSLESVGSLYIRVARNAKELGRTQAELTEFSSLLSKGLVISGASAREASSAMLQLSQALASGRLQGDEFRSVSENFPILMEAIIYTTGRTRAEIRKLSSENAITAEVILQSVEAYKEVINQQYALIESTPNVGRAYNKFKNQVALTTTALVDVTEAKKGAIGTLGLLEIAYRKFGGIIIRIKMVWQAFAFAFVAGVGKLVEAFAHLGHMFKKLKLGMDSAWQELTSWGDGDEIRANAEKQRKVLQEEHDKFMAYLKEQHKEKLEERKKEMKQSFIDMVAIQEGTYQVKTAQSPTAIPTLQKPIIDLPTLGHETKTKLKLNTTEAKKKLQDLQGQMKSSTTNTSRLITDAITGDFRTMTFSLSSMWKRLLANMVASVLAKSGIFKAGGLLTAMMGGGSVNFFAKGGIVNSPTGFYDKSGGYNVMGEAGAEAILPLKRGKGGEMGVQVQGGKGNGSTTYSPTIQTTINIQSIESEEKLDTLKTSVEDMIEAKVVDTLREYKRVVG